MHIVKPRGRVLLAGAAGALPVFAVWARSGTHVPWQSPLLYLAGLLLGVYLLAGEDRPASALRRLIKDPLWVPVGVFIALLLLQWENAGRVRIYDFEQGAWVFSDPRRIGWPSAFTRGEAFEMLSWFVPAGILLLVVRRLSGAWGIRLVLGILFFAALNAGLGIVQELAHLRSMFGLIPMHTHFFASFGYGNHAASFYVLCLAWALGLLMKSFARHPSERPAGLLPGLLLVAVLLFVAANLSMSLAGILFSWSLVLFATFYGIWIFRYRIHPLVGLRVAVGVGLCLLIVGILLVERGSNKMFTEVRAISERGLDHEILGRQEQAAVAIDLFKQAPWFGLGGWGYRYHVAEYMPPRKWDWGLQGAANAHNDPAQFLAEFGLVGFIALAAILLGLGGELLRSAGRAAKQGFSWRHDPLWVMGLAGLSITLVHGLIDLPFRCPAILYTWVVFAAVLTLETKNTMHKHSVT
jgi:O-antigen ligase